MRKLTEVFVLIIVGFWVQTSLSVQNQAPTFEPRLQSNYFFHEYNLTKPGDILLWLNATDPDDDDLEFGVENGFYRKLLSVKKVDNKHATVIANQIFDRETQEKYENIVFYVKDKPGNKVYQSVRFVILDIDDQLPVFKRTPYRVSISESTEPGTLIFDAIEAIDSDGPLYNKFELRLSARDAEAGIFALEKTQFRASGHYSTSLVLKKRLDYESCKTHLVTVEAAVAVKTAAAGTGMVVKSTSEVVVTVLDVPNRAPEFTQSPYYVKLEEEMPVGEFVVHVQAKDGDSGINNPCRYEIINDDSAAIKYFDIDSQTGVVRIKERIDLESAEVGGLLGGLLEFSVRAIEIVDGGTDGGGDEQTANSTTRSSSTRVIVSVSDINDNEPRISKPLIRLNLLPTQASAGSTLALVEDDIDSIRVFDPDKGVNGSMSLYLFKVLNNESYDHSVDFEIIPKLVLNDGNLIVKVKSDFNVTNKIGSIQHYHLIAKDNGINGKAVRADLLIKIEYINQYAPQFLNKSYLFRIDENSPFNTTVGYMIAFDNDTYEDFGQVSYELKNGQNRFLIDKQTGRVFTVSKSPDVELDRESIDTYYMHVEATDGGGLRTSAQVIVKLDDVNDNRPQFINNLYQSSSSSVSPQLALLRSSPQQQSDQQHTLIGYIEENTDKWFEPIRLQAFDRDLGSNGHVEFEIEPGDDDDEPVSFQHLFRVNTTSKCVDLAGNVPLDFEEIVRLKKKTRSQNQSQLVLPAGEIAIDLVIVARDLGTPSLSSRINARVIVKDVNDNKPIFEKMFYSAEVYETTKMGDVIQVRAFDQDAPDTANSKIIYSIESGNRDKFFIDSSSGWVRVNENTNLDRDVYGAFYTLRIAASDFGSINIPTQTTTAAATVTATATTVEPFTTTPFMIYEYFNSSTSSSSSLNNATWTTPITTVPAESFCFLTIKVLDVNNKSPKFVDYPDVVTISEDAPLNTNIIKMEAIDLDLDSNLFYFLIKDNSTSVIRAFDENNNQIDSDLLIDWFGIDPKSGYLYTRSALDREIAELIYVVVGVEDLNAAVDFKPQITTTIVKVRLLDVNDNYPIFPNFGLVNVNYSSIEAEGPIFETYGQVEENTKLNTRVAQLRAKDADKYKNITYKIVHSTDHPTNSLAIDKLNGFIYVNGPIDYEESAWVNLTILVDDNTGGKLKTKHSLVHFHFEVLDLNDNAPKFVQLNTTEFLVRENNEPGAVIAQFTAVDADSNEYGQVVYRLLNGGNDKFEIDPFNGILRARVVFDREEQDRYTLVIQAVDNPEPSPSSNTSTATSYQHHHQNQLTDALVVKIRIVDENDNRPECEQATYRLEVSQNVDVGTILTQVKGIDNDLGRNSQLRYFINAAASRSSTNADLIALNEMITINPLNGQIRTKKKLTEYSGVYQYVITLMDNGPAASLMMPSTTAAITTSNETQHISHASSNLLEQSNLSGTCILEIYVKDYNMHPPRFIYPNVNNSILRIKSSTPIGAKLLTVEAVDEDRGENGKISYRIDNTRPNNNDWKKFALDASTGVLSVNARLTPLEQSSYTIDLIAFDHGRQPAALSSRFTLVVILVDEANNSAHFNRVEICLHKGFECERDYQAVIVRFREELNLVNNSAQLNVAKIGDLNKNSTDICYYLIGVDRQHFKLGQKSGVLTPRSRLDREKRDKYEVIVKSSEHCACNSTDADYMLIINGTSSAWNISDPCWQLFNKNNSNSYDPNDISLLRVKIHVTDINDHVPRFAKNFYQIGVTTDVEFGDVILDSYAYDLDVTGLMNISIDTSSLKSNADTQPHGGGNFPFALKYFDESRLSIGNYAGTNAANKSSKTYRFQLKTNVYFKPPKSAAAAATTAASTAAVAALAKSTNGFGKNILYQFNLSVSDENSSNTDTAIVQILLINKQQRVKLVFSQPIDKVVKFQDEFQTYISKLTGYKAYIDKIYLHKSDDDFDPVATSGGTSKKSSTTTNRPIYLTDMLLHFTMNETPIMALSNQTYTIVNADQILTKLDRSVDMDLLKKYKLTVAEKYDEHGSSVFYKYGSSGGAGHSSDSGSDYINFFDFDDDDDESSNGDGSSSSSASATSASSLLTRLVLLIACFLLTFLLVSTVVVFYCMRKTYARKLRAERAMVKAFGLEQTSMMTTATCTAASSARHNHGVTSMGGYLNMAFDSNKLLPIPGTNLYAYEGSNPMWLKKYEKIDAKNNTSASVTSSSLPSSSSTNDENSRRDIGNGGDRDGEVEDGVAAINNNNNNKNSNHMKKRDRTDYEDKTIEATTIKQVSSSSSSSSTSSSSSLSPKIDKDDIASFYLKQIDSTSASPLKLPGDANAKQAVIDELSTIYSRNYLSDEMRSSLPLPPPPPPADLSAYQRETLLTFACDDTLINNAISAALNNSNQTMLKSFKKQQQQRPIIHHHQHQQQQSSDSSSSLVDEFLMGSSRKKPSNFLNAAAPSNSNKKLLLDQYHKHFHKSTHFTKIFDSCATGATTASSCTNTLMSTASSRLNAKEDNFLLINQPSTLGKDVCDLFAVESTVI